MDGSRASGETMVLPYLQMGRKVQGEMARITTDYNIMTSQPSKFVKNS